jgi:predicted cupin superfamily sugar epimerase
MGPTAEEIKRMFAMQPHETCGFFTQSYLSNAEIAREALPPGYDGPRPLASALYFLVTPEARMVLHRLRSDQVCTTTTSATRWRCCYYTATTAARCSPLAAT